MYDKFPWGTVEQIQGIACHIPAAGYVLNILTGEMEKPGVYKRNPRQKLQYWERPLPPEDYDERERREEMTGIIDPVCENYRRQEWYRRLNGFWFYNNGEPTYITGLHYFFLTHWYIGTTLSGYPDYRDRDRKFFYFLQYSIEDPNSLGVLYVTKRREGKTSKGAIFLAEPATRTQGFRGGIQSKSEHDAAVVVFQQAVVNPYLKLPSFFRPTFDTSGGRRPKKQLVFTQPSTRGKRAVEQSGEELNSIIDYKSSTTYAYDGARLDRYLADEVLKTSDLDIQERARVVRYCLTDGRGKFSGRALYTSTVEEISGKIQDYRQFWDDSDQTKRDGNGRTKTGLYRYFTPAFEALNYDEFGVEDIEANRVFLINEREALKNDQIALNSLMRKLPFSVEEAFRVSKDQAAYDNVRINDQIEAVASFQGDMIIRGDLVWTDGPDSKVKFVEMVNGPFALLKNQDGYEPGDERSGVRKVSGVWVPNNKHINTGGVDPFDHVTTVDSRRSNGAAYLYRKFDALNPEKTGLFVMEYIYRETHPKIFYESMIKLCVWAGCDLLFEDNKPGIRHYFEERGYLPCLVHLPDRKEPGLPSSFKTKQELVEVTKSYVLDSIHKVYFLRLLEDWRDFEPTNTKVYDAAMSASFTLLSDKSAMYARSNRPDERGKRVDLRKIFR